ncbi:MAG: ATP-binding protein [Prevotellaceae bacterium]|jgi:hypothetical protein|nr:ATP-binding protein [Prevotellaceae bacterium]
MEVKLGQAIKMFFGNSSLEMVFFEAIANSLDAEATEIDINISTKAYNQPGSLTIQISDNGIGFTEDRYQKFSKLFDVDENSHKGLGRLVYLCYFDNVKVSSFYERTKYREFEFTEDFDARKFNSSAVKDTDSGTTISMSGYTWSKLGKQIYIQSPYLKGRILEEFYPKLFQLKQQGKNIAIKISSKIENEEQTKILTNKDIPAFEMVELDNSVTFSDKFELYYSIEKVDISETSLVAAISVDNRTKKVDLVAHENLFAGFKMVFLLYSDWFKGKVDFSRQNIATSESEKQTMQDIQLKFRKKVVSIIEERIPIIKKRNKETKNSIINKYPHLSNYLDSKDIGYLSRSDVLRKAQDRFFKDQRDLLDAHSLSPEQYKKSLELSSMALTEYILFRQKTIESLKKTNNKSSESDIHNLFVSMKRLFIKENATDDLYRNSAWLLDDKYMTYETILSDRKMSEVINYITQGEVMDSDDDRPDIALIFSNDPDKNDSFDVVIVELKKRGITLEENMKVITQLEKRARKLMQYYKNKIQRIWFYGVIEFNSDIELALSGEYKELYSNGKMYYRETMVAIQKNPDIKLPIGVFVLDLDSIINDADSRNSVFLNLMKSKFINTED